MNGMWDDEHWEDIGHGVEITRIASEESSMPLGVMERHVCADGEKHIGHVPFYGHGQTWVVEQAEPLTLSPSIACRSCPNHGFIREGAWVPA